MFNLEVYIPKLCELAQENGDDERAHHLRAAGLQALSSMVHRLKHHILGFYSICNNLKKENVMYLTYTTIFRPPPIFRFHCANEIRSIY